MSAGTLQPRTFYQFGPFRVDPERETISRDGEQVPVTPKAFKILLVLLRRGQDVVSKDDLMEAVWPDTFVEEANLSRNVFLLRKALGEGPRDHQYVLTVPGRGYRLAERARLIVDAQESIDGATDSAETASVEARAAPSRIEWRAGERFGRRWVALAVAAVLTTAGVAAWRLWPRAPRLTERDLVVLADFTNATGDPVFDETLRQGLAVQLEQSPYLNLISEDRVRRTLQLMRRPADSRLTPEVAREVCERTGAAAVLAGSIRSLGAAYVLGLRATTCGSGALLDEEQVQAARKEEVLSGLSRIAARFRERTGESLASVKKYSVPLEDATTPSLGALQFYSRAVKVAFTAGFAAAVPLMQRAIEIDPSFALAHAHLGLFCSAIGESGLAVESARRAYALRDRASERERFFITALYHRNATGNLRKARQTLEAWARVYPRDILAHGLLSGFSSQGLGAYQSSLDEARVALDLDPEFTPAYTNRAFSQLYLDRPADAEKTVREALAKKLRVPELLLMRYLLAYERRDATAMDAAVAAGRGIAGAEDWLLHAQSLALARSGRLSEARTAGERAMRLAESAGEHERAATYEAAAAVWEALYGRRLTARSEATAAVEASTSRDTEYAAALALAIAGDADRAQALARDLERRFPEDTSAGLNYLPALRALLALQRGAPSEAIRVLQPAAPAEPAISAMAFNYLFGMFDPVYVRGLALLAAGRPAEAAAELEKIVTHRGLVLVDPLEAFARLELARAYTKTHEIERAKAAYAELLFIWRDADRDVPLCRQARAAFAALH